MEIERLPLAEALVITPSVFRDDRGYFKETFSASRYGSAGIVDEFVQDNVSFSRRNVLRGLHGDPRMSKLVQVVAGAAYDVIVDIRAGSPSYGRWCGVSLRDDEHRQVYVPRGFLHGFLTLSDTAIFLYKQGAEYDPASEIGVAWNDPDLAIDWPLSGPPVLSAKDAAHPKLRDL